MPSESKGDRPYIFFELAGTTYGIAAELVQQMEMVEQITPVPNAPGFVDGVIFARGQVVPVVNLRARFGFARVTQDPKTRLIVVAHEGRTVGLLVDSAREFTRLTDGQLKPPPEAVTGLSGKYLAGIATSGDRIVLILDIAEVLNFQDVISTINEH